MPVSITMPQLGESVTEGTVTRWLKTSVTPSRWMNHCLRSARTRSTPKSHLLPLVSSSKSPPSKTTL